MYGKHNTGPRCEVWAIGDRVKHINTHHRGRVAAPRRDPGASEVGCVWAEWDDGEAGYDNPNMLNVA